MATKEVAKTFVISLFTDAVRVYAVPNLGHRYDVSFVLSIDGFSGGVFVGSRRRGWRRPSRSMKRLYGSLRDADGDYLQASAGCPQCRPSVRAALGQ